MLKVKIRVIILFFMALVELYKAVKNLTGENASLSHIIISLYVTCVSMDAIIIELM